MCETAVVKEFKGPAETHVIKLRTLALILKGQAKKVSLDGRRADEVLEIKGGDNASKRKIAIGTVIKAPGLLVLGKTENRAGYELIKVFTSMMFTTDLCERFLSRIGIRGR